MAGAVEEFYGMSWWEAEVEELGLTLVINKWTRGKWPACVST